MSGRVATSDGGHVVPAPGSPLDFGGGVVDAGALEPLEAIALEAPVTRPDAITTVRLATSVPSARSTTRRSPIVQRPVT